MDVLYDTDKASRRLDEFINSRRLLDYEKQCLGNDATMDAFKIERCGEPECLRALSVHGQGSVISSNERKEKIFAIQGVISKFIFVVPRAGDVPERMEHRIVLTGLKASGFEQIVESLKDIDVRMSREVVGEWKDWKPSTNSDYPAVTLSCRLLTPMSQCERAGNDVQYAVPREFDPEGVLFKLVSSQKFKILPENTLSLYRLNEYDGTPFVEDASPNNFLEGDIVEARFICCAIPTGIGRKVHRMKLVLRSIMIKDTEFSNEARKRSRNQFESHGEQDSRGKRLKVAQETVKFTTEEFKRYEANAPMQNVQAYRIPQRRSIRIKRASNTPEASNISKRLEALEMNK